MFKNDGGLFEKFTPEELITNLMMYWIPNKMTTAMRIYAESFNSKSNSLAQQYVFFPHKPNVTDKVKLIIIVILVYSHFYIYIDGQWKFQAHVHNFLMRFHGFHENFWPRDF